MSDRIARFPSLHTVPENPDDPPALLGSRCRCCQRLFFPMRRFGCPSCGAAPQELEGVELAGRGRLEAFARVHRSFSAEFPAPYAVGRIALDCGIEVEAVLGDCDPAALRPGAMMQAILVTRGRDDAGREQVECRFEPSQEF